jgi:hypothetical protein
MLLAFSHPENPLLESEIGWFIREFPFGLSRSPTPHHPELTAIYYSLYYFITKAIFLPLGGAFIGLRTRNFPVKAAH